VEDYEPMRQTVRVRLQKRRDLQVICEASDGLEAVQKATELKPDLVEDSKLSIPPSQARRQLTRCRHQHSLTVWRI
jgi:DNA-binding NarL/FixJ family response regulator